ncbi:tetratricopeptide repeat protein [Actinoplanes sp. RD1]|uniref:tetratricopeptide repeat protein n=1 Tax=Actinoplanes sp. RD1 TaxID=3064538 RepID=UPI00274144EF|nr:tetratricopeptide repeat protein [Actinoplanes sp. RD1]
MTDDAPLDAALRKLLLRFPRVREMLEVWCQDSLRIELVEELTDGRTEAVVALVKMSDRTGHEPRRLIMKYLPPRRRTRLDFDKLVRARQEAPEQFRERLVEVRYDRPVAIDTDSTVLFMDYPLLRRHDPAALTSLLRDAALGKTCHVVLHALFEEWNGREQRRVEEMPADVYLQRIAQWTCEPRGQLYERLRKNRSKLLELDCDTLPGDNGSLPNPVHLTRFGGDLIGRPMQVFRGRTHGDLHTDNILVAATGARGGADFRLIDLSSYDPDGFLAYDAAYLICSILAHRMADLPEDSGPLIRLMTGDPKRSAAAFPHDVRDAVRRIGQTCRESAPPPGWSLKHWYPNLLLAITGCALIYAGRELPAGDKALPWFIEFAARAAKAALSFLPDPVGRDTPVSGPAPWEQLIDRANFRILVLSGREGIGKTYALQRRLEKLRTTDADFTVRWIDLETEPSFGAADLVAILQDKIRPEKGAPARAYGRESDLLLGRLDALLDALGNRRVVVAIDCADRLIDDSGTMRDWHLNEALQLLSERTDHAVSIILISRTALSLDRQGWFGVAEIHTFDDGMTVEQLKSFCTAVDRSGVYRPSEDDKAWTDLRDRFDGNPRTGELAFALLDLVESGFADIRDVAAMLAEAEPQDSIGALFEALVPRLTELEQRILLALAVYRIPVDVDAVHAVTGLRYAGPSVGHALRRLASRRVIRHVGERYYLCYPDDERVIGCLGGEDARYEFGLRADAYLASLPEDRIEGLRDLWAYRARIDILIACGEFTQVNGVMRYIDGTYLSRWGYSWLLIGHREQLRDHLDDAREQRDNLHWLGKQYTDVGRLIEAQECYQAAIDMTDMDNELSAPKRLLNNMARIHFRRRRTAEAITTYRQALSLARRYNDAPAEVKTLEGLADCRRRLGGITLGDKYLERALRLASGDEVFPLQLKMARRDVESGRLWDAECRLVRAGKLLQESDDPAGACTLLDIDADLKLARGRDDLALAQAHRAASLAGRVGDPHVVVQARTTLAVVHLRHGRLQEARREIEAAHRRRAEGDSLLVLAVRGIVHHLLAEHDIAKDDFGRLRNEAFTRREREDKDFGAWDFEGIAICGLFLYGKAVLPSAQSAFDTARRICRPAGLVKQLEDLIEILDAGSGRLIPGITAAGSGPTG